MTSNKPISKNNHITNEGDAKDQTICEITAVSLLQPTPQSRFQNFSSLMFLIACQGNLLPGNISL